MLTDADILEALRACFEPRTKLNVVDLGLVRAVRLEVDREAPGAGIMGVPVRQRLVVRLLAAANEDEDAWSLLQGQVANRLAGIEGLSRVTVERATEEAWTPALVSAVGRRALGLDAPAFSILNNKVPGWKKVSGESER